MSKNTKPGTKSKGQEKIEQSAYINQIIAPKQAPKEDAHLEAKIEQVKVVTNWPDDDIKRVLEECNYDTQKAISNILDGKTTFFQSVTFIKELLAIPQKIGG